MSCSHAAAGRGSWTCQTGGGAAVLRLVHKCMRDAAFFAGPAEVTVLPKPFKLMAIPLLPPTVTNRPASKPPAPLTAQRHCVSPARTARVDARGGAAGVVTQYGRNGRSRSRGAEARNALRPGGHPRGRGGAPPAARAVPARGRRAGLAPRRFTGRSGRGQSATTTHVRALAAGPKGPRQGPRRPARARRTDALVGRSPS